MINGTHLYTGSTDGLIKKFDIESGKELATFKGHTRGIEDLLISEDGEYLYSASSDRSIRKWELSSGSEVAKYEGHLTSVYKLHMHDDTLYSGESLSI